MKEGDDEIGIEDQFNVAIVSRMKHGDLFKAMKARGWNQTQTAEFLGISISSFGGMINLKQLPKTVPDRVNQKFVELTGKMYEDLFPEELRNSKFISAEKEAVIYADIPMPLLLQGFIPKQLASPEEVFEEREFIEKLDEMLDTLPGKEAEVLRMRFFEDKTAEEIAAKVGYSPKYINQVENRALRHMRHPSRSRPLKAYVKT